MLPLYHRIKGRSMVFAHPDPFTVPGLYVYEDHVKIVFMYAKNGHDTVEIPFDIDAIPEVKCSFKKKWWR